MNVTKAMVLAAGVGSRLRPLTEHTPKALIKIQGKTLIEILLQRLKSYGIEAVVINVHHHAQQIIDFVQDNQGFGLQVEFSREEQLLDTGGGLKKVRAFFEDTQQFLVHNVDILTDMDFDLLFRRLEATNSLAALAVRQRKTSRYLLFDGQMRLVGWQNKRTGELKIVRKIFPAFRPLAFSGVQAVHRRIFDYMPSDNVFSLIDLYLQLAYRSLPIFGVRTDNSYWLDVGKPEALAQAEERFTDFLKHNEA